MSFANQDDILSTIQRHICEGLAELGTVNCDQATLIAQRIAVKLSFDFGGQEIYISKMLAKSLRDEAICKAFNGTNYLALAKQYGVTERWIRLIVEESVQAKRAAQNPTLFDL